MSQSKLVVTAGLTALIVGSLATAAVADTINGSATAVVLTPLTVSQTTELDFGTLYAGSTAGTVVIPADGSAVTATGGTTYVSGATRSQFTVSGAVSTLIDVTVDGTGARLGDGTGNLMPLTLNATNGLDTNGLVTTGTTDGSGGLIFYIGATLSVGPNQTEGTYSTATGGTPYTVTVNYN